jgi:hypothetical protein
VSCGVTGVACQPGQVCCYHVTNSALDHCGRVGACGFGYLEFSCNSKDDCDGEICCATVDGFGTIAGIACATSCNGSNNYVMCDRDTDCSDLSCDPFPSPSNHYPNYGWCFN